MGWMSLGIHREEEALMLKMRTTKKKKNQSGNLCCEENLSNFRETQKRTRFFCDLRGDRDSSTRDWRRRLACAKEGKSLTEANAILGRGKMFVLSREQARVLVGRSLMHRHRGGEEGGEGDDDDDNAVVDGGAYLDIGSGQGEVASKLGEYFGTVVATETSPAMVKRCAESHKDWTVLETGTIEDVWEKFKMQNAREEEEGTSTKSEAAKKKVRELLDEEEGIETTEHQHQGHGGKFDCIGMFNVLDRCDRPFTMLSHVRNLLKPKTGLFVLAVVLPFRPFVELDDGTRRPPSEKLDVATPTAAWEYGCRDLYENVLKPSGFEIEKSRERRTSARRPSRRSVRFRRRRLCFEELPRCRRKCWFDHSESELLDFFFENN